MSPFRLPFALLTLFGIVAVIPVWMHFQTEYSGGLTPETRFIALLVLPSVVALFAGSWMQGG